MLPEPLQNEYDKWVEIQNHERYLKSAITELGLRTFRYPTVVHEVAQELIYLATSIALLRKVVDQSGATRVHKQLLTDVINQKRKIDKLLDEGNQRVF